MKTYHAHPPLSLVTKTFVFGVLVLCPFFSARTSAAVPTSVTLQVDDYTETITSEQIARFTRFDTRLAYSPKAASEIENIQFCPTNKLYCAFSVSHTLRNRLTNTLTSAADTAAIGHYIDELAERTAQDPVDVRFSVIDDRIVVAEPEKNGRSLKKEESIALLARIFQTAEAESAKIVLPTEITKPKLVASDRERLGLRELVGEGKTNFRGSPKNRIYNIKRALKQFENVIIAPGEEFSFVKYLGEVDGEHGYLPELVIKHNETIPEFGGGICQVSSTVFRAAIYSGMKITGRRNHAYPVQYYRPYGMDATIYIPKPDLTFVNNTPGAVLMQSIIEGTDLTFRFYGTKDGRSVAVDGPHILQRNPDGSMKTVFSQLVTDMSGNSLINDSFWSNYKSPSLFPHPGEEIIKEKPADWSKKQWEEYKKIHP